MSNDDPPPAPRTSLLRIQQVADLLGVPAGTVRWWIHTGRLPHVRFGPRTPRFRSEDIDAFISENMRRARVKSASHRSR